MGDAEPPGQRPQAHRRRTLPVDQLQGRVQQVPAQVAAVVGRVDPGIRATVTIGSSLQIGSVNLRRQIGSVNLVAALVGRTTVVTPPGQTLSGHDVVPTRELATGASRDRGQRRLHPRHPLEDGLELIAVNVTAIVQLAKRVLPGMVERGAGKVLVTSSVAATMLGPYYATYATYAASKAFLQSSAQAIRFELRTPASP